MGGSYPLYLKSSMLQHMKNINSPSLPVAENTHLLCKRKYHCMDDLLFDWLGFSCFVELKLQTDLLVWPNPNRSNRRSAVQ